MSNKNVILRPRDELSIELTEDGIFMLIQQTVSGKQTGVINIDMEDLPSFLNAIQAMIDEHQLE
jgi:hypothetical protein